MKAAIYTRISRDTEGKGLGVARQQTECRELAERKGWDVVEVFTDNDISAYSGKPRPGYNSLLESIESGEVDALVAFHPDRLHRSPKELEPFIDLVERTKVAIATVAGGEYDLGTSSGRLQARVVGAVARAESETKSERAKSKHRQMAESGRVGGGGSRPFGFEDDRVRIRDSEAEIVREVVARLLTGDTIRGIATDLNKRGITTPTGKRWQSASLRRMALSPRIAGLRQHQGKVVGQAEWDGIITEAEHGQLKQLFNDPRRRKYSPANGRPYLLTGGLVVCGRCGTNLVARPKDRLPGEEVGRRAYVCAAGTGFSGCGRIRSLADPVEELVRDAIATRLAGKGLQLAIEEVASPDANTQRAIEDLHRQEDKQTQLAEDYANDLIDHATYLKTATLIRTSIEELRQKVASRGNGGSMPDLPTDYEGIKERWDSEPMAWRRRLTSLVIDRVTLQPAVKGRNFFDPSRVEVSWLF